MAAFELEGWATREAGLSPREQLTGLMNHFEQPLCNYLHVLLGDRDLAMDCVQDTFLRAYQQLERGRPVQPGWLYKVARNRAMDEFRHKSRVRYDSEELERLSGDEDTPRTLNVRRVLAQLPPADREVLYLFSVDRFETADIAAMLGVRPGAIRMRLVRARDRFRHLYQGDL